MTVLKIIGVIVLILLLVCFIRVGGIAEYSSEGLIITLRIGAFQFLIYPKKSKKEKRKKGKSKNSQSKQPQQNTPTEEAPPTETASQSETTQTSSEEKENEKTPTPKKASKKGGSFRKFKQYLPCISEAVKGLRQRIVIEQLTLHLVTAAQDAMSAAMTFGYSNMLIGIVLPVFEQNFTVRKREISTDVDFSAQEPTVYLKLNLSMRVGQAISLALRLLYSFIQLKMKSEKKTQP